jgi:hypothetical protein
MEAREPVPTLSVDISVKKEPMRVEEPPIRDDGLQLEENRPFQERLWSTERWAWLAFFAIIAAAIGGFTGAGGYFSHAETNLAGGTIDRPRISRWQASDTFTLRFAPGGTERRLTLSPAFAETFHLEDIQPAPERFEALPSGESMIFLVPQGAPATVWLHVRAMQPGLATYAASIDGGPPASLSTFVMP